MGFKTIPQRRRHLEKLSSKTVFFGESILSSSPQSLLSNSEKRWKRLQVVRRKSSESEILAKIFADMGEKRCSENLATVFIDVHPSISRKSPRKKFHEKSSTNFTSQETKFFQCETLGAGPENWSRIVALHCCVFGIPVLRPFDAPSAEEKSSG